MPHTFHRLAPAIVAALFLPSVVLAQEEDKSAVQSVYDMSQSAETADDYTAMIDECQRLPQTGLSEANGNYVTRLMSWAYNRRGEARAEEATAKVEEGDAATAAQLDATALEDFNTAIKLDGKVAESWANQALVYERRGEKDKAAKSYQQAVRLDPNYQPAVDGLARTKGV